MASTHKKHEMKLYDGPFDLMKSGRKTIEVRCNDEKRRAISEGDTILFRRYTNPEDKLLTRVVALHSFPTFRELYAAFPMDKFGVSDQTPDSMAAAVGKIYTQEQQAKYGALAITLELVPPQEWQITRLEGPDRVRKRPEVVFGSADLAGAQRLVSDILNIYATEAQLGHCKCLRVIQEGADLIICGEDRGIWLGQETGDKEQWKNIFDNFYYLPAYAPDEEGYSFRLQSPSHHVLYGDPVEEKATFYPEDMSYFELYCAQCACKVMDVISVRGGIRSTLHFEEGHNIGGIRHEASEDKTGTIFHLELDQQVFSKIEIPAQFFLETLERFAMLSPGLVCTYINAGKRVEFSFPRGISDYVRRNTTVPVYYKRIQGKGKERYNRGEYEACVEIAVAPTPNQGGVLCLHNFRELPYGGTHYRRMQERLCRAFNNVFCEETEKAPLCYDELRKHFTVVLTTWCAPYFSNWENGTRLSIRNRVIMEMTEDATSRELDDYVYSHREQLRPAIKAILQDRCR